MEALTTRALARSVEAHRSIGSTNDRAKEIAAQGALHGSCVVAEEQTAGRGSRGRAWSSPPGAGLYASFVLRPKIAPIDSPMLTLAASLAVASAVDAPVGIKWPNDVVSSAGLRKVAGILVESSSDLVTLASAVIGIGVNLREAGRPESLSGYATSLEALGAAELDARAVLMAIANRLEPLLDRLEVGDRAGILEAWRARAIGLGGPVTIEEHGEVTSGVMAGVGADGSLLVDVAGSRRVFHTGELRLPGAPHRP